MRKRELLLINRFGTFVNYGITTLKQLYNEATFPRNNYLKDLATYILSFFPSGWVAALGMGLELSTEINYENEFPAPGLMFLNHNQITVKALRRVLIELEEIPMPIYSDNKFEIVAITPGINPFLNLRKYVHMPRDKWFKYRILQGDIFCKTRLFNFKLADTPFCDFCNDNHTMETIKHLLWDCPRSQQLWSYLQNLISSSYQVNYINYHGIILGSENAIPVLESLILLALKLIIVKDRSNYVTNAQLESRIKSQYFIEKRAMKVKELKFKNRWSFLAPILFRNRN